MHSTRHDFLLVAPKEVLCAPIFVWMLFPVIIQIPACVVFERFPVAMDIYIYIYISIEREREERKIPEDGPAQKDAVIKRGKVNTTVFALEVEVEVFV